MTSPLVHGLPPIAGKGAHTLIVGNMLSVMSVASKQYYGNPRNAFWRITGELYGFAADDPYDERTAALVANGVAVWDALKSCRRAGSLDSAVEPDSMVPNDFGKLFDAHPGIARVFFNGAAAQKNYIRFVGFAPEVRYMRLPSTSPAHTLRYEDKLAIWRDALMGG